MKKYYKFTTAYPIENYVTGSTEKAICVTVAGGYTTINDTKLWIPRSILKFSEPNEYGNMYVYLPQWFIAKNRLFNSVYKIRDLEFRDIVEM